MQAPPGIFPFFFLSGAAPIRRAPQDKLVFDVYGACGSSGSGVSASERGLATDAILSALP